ncbi:MAG: Spy/CpxP family protein refolding chaperone [Steroidobacteraceae bacterium]
MSRLSVLLMLVISICAGMVGAQIMVERALKAYPGPPAGALAGAAAIARNTVELSEAQKRELTRIEATHTARMRELRREVSAATLGLRNTMDTAPDQGDAGQAAAQRLQAASGELLSESLAFLQDVRRLLTPSQRAQLDTKIQHLLENTARNT